MNAYHVALSAFSLGLIVALIVQKIRAYDRRQ